MSRFYMKCPHYVPFFMESKYNTLLCVRPCPAKFNAASRFYHGSSWHVCIRGYAKMQLTGFLGCTIGLSTNMFLIPSFFPVPTNVGCFVSHSFNLNYSDNCLRYATKVMRANYTQTYMNEVFTQLYCTCFV